MNVETKAEDLFLKDFLARLNGEMNICHLKGTVSYYHNNSQTLMRYNIVYLKGTWTYPT